jgi:hypothetical protein
MDRCNGTVIVYMPSKSKILYPEFIFNDEV